MAFLSISARRPGSSLPAKLRPWSLACFVFLIVLALMKVSMQRSPTPRYPISQHILSKSTPTHWVVLSTNVQQNYLYAATISASLWGHCGFRVFVIVSLNSPAETESPAISASQQVALEELKRVSTILEYDYVGEPKLGRITHIVSSHIRLGDVVTFSDADTAPRYAMCYMFALKHTWLQVLKAETFAAEEKWFDFMIQIRSWAEANAIHISSYDEQYISFHASSANLTGGVVLLDRKRSYDKNPRLPYGAPYLWSSVFGSKPTRPDYMSLRKGAYDMHYGHDNFSLTEYEHSEMLLQILSYYYHSDSKEVATFANVSAFVERFWRAESLGKVHSSSQMFHGNICVYLPAYLIVESLWHSAVKGGEDAHDSSILNFDSSSINHASEIAVAVGIAAHQEVTFCPSNILSNPKLHDDYLLYFPLALTMCKSSGCTSVMNEMLANITNSTFFSVCGGSCFAMTDLWGEHVENLPNSILLQQHSYAGSIHGARQSMRWEDRNKHSKHIIIPYLEMEQFDITDVKHREIFVFLTVGKRNHALDVRQMMVSSFQNFTLNRIRDTIDATEVKVNWISEDQSSQRTGIITEMGNSIFCLCPKGDSDDTLRLFSAILSGCIPVIVSDWIILPFEDVIPYDSFAFFLAEKDVALLPELLHSMPEEEIFFRHLQLLRHREGILYRRNLTDIRPREAIDNIVRALKKRTMLAQELLPWLHRTSSIPLRN
jgi:hypothetical protein